MNNNNNNNNNNNDDDNNNNNNKFPSILKYTFLYFEYLSQSEIIIIESKQYLQTQKGRIFFFDFLKKRDFLT